jgi:hypothetical protein
MAEPYYVQAICARLKVSFEYISKMRLQSLSEVASPGVV